MAKNETKNKWNSVLKIIIVLAIFSFIVSWFLSFFVVDDFDLKEGNVALIPIKGVIMGEKGRSFAYDIADSPTIVRFIEKADKNPKIKAILLEINSPGGSPVATDEIAKALERTNKTTVAVIREVGASGAYWIASSCDKIVANRMSIVGSIGVIASYIQFSGILSDHNITYERLVAGKFKDIGSPFKPLEAQERDMLQQQINTMHGFFIAEVAKNRNLPEENVRKLANGMFYIGEQAKDFGLIDVLGGKEEAKEIIEQELNITAELVEYKQEKTLVELLSGIFSEQSFFVGKGIGTSLFETKENSKVEIWT